MDWEVILGIASPIVVLVLVLGFILTKYLGAKGEALKQDAAEMVDAMLILIDTWRRVNADKIVTPAEWAEVENAAGKAGAKGIAFFVSIYEAYQDKKAESKEKPPGGG